MKFINWERQGNFKTSMKLVISSYTNRSRWHWCSSLWSICV